MDKAGMLASVVEKTKRTKITNVQHRRWTISLNLMARKIHMPPTSASSSNGSRWGGRKDPLFGNRCKVLVAGRSLVKRARSLNGNVTTEEIMDKISSPVKKKRRLKEPKNREIRRTQTSFRSVGGGQDLPQLCQWYSSCLLFLCVSGLILCFAYFQAQLKFKPMNYTELMVELNQSVYGQNIALAEIVKTLEDFLTQEIHTVPLVVSFHGGTGVGKTFTARMLEKYFIRHGGKVYWLISPDANQFIGFPSLSHYSLCPVNLVIIDDIDWTDSFKQQLKDLITTMKLETKDQLIKIIFLITSNSGAVEINEIAMSEMKHNHTLQNIDLNTFKSLQSSVNIESPNALSIRFIPFLPLEKESVILCVKNMLTFQNVTEANITSVMRQLNYFPDDFPVFAQLGCKKIPI